MTADPFAGFDLESRIVDRAGRCGLALPERSVAFLALHARAVLSENERLHLTAIRDPETFVERHLGEAFEGAKMLDDEIEGVLVDLGSGNGYPGIPLAVARPGLRPVLAEATPGKAAFLTTVVDQGFDQGRVLAAPVQRAADLHSVDRIDVLVSRAMGGWERIVPKVARRLELDGRVLLWAGAEVEPVAHRASWSTLRLEKKFGIPGRDRSWIWEFHPQKSRR